MTEKLRPGVILEKGKTRIILVEEVVKDLKWSYAIYEVYIVNQNWKRCRLRLIKNPIYLSQSSLQGRSDLRGWRIIGEDQNTLNLILNPTESKLF